MQTVELLRIVVATVGGYGSGYAANGAYGDYAQSATVSRKVRV